MKLVKVLRLLVYLSIYSTFNYGWGINNNQGAISYAILPIGRYESFFLKRIQGYSLPQTLMINAPVELSDWVLEGKYGFNRADHYCRDLSFRTAAEQRHAGIDPDQGEKDLPLPLCCSSDDLCGVGSGHPALDAAQ